MAAGEVLRRTICRKFFPDESADFTVRASVQCCCRGHLEILVDGELLMYEKSFSEMVREASFCRLGQESKRSLDSLNYARVGKTE